MPNPLSDNDAAAQFLDFYASAGMQKQVVDRLYSQGVRNHNIARQKAEATMEPTRPIVTRTPREIEEYLQRTVEGGKVARQKRLIELEHQRRLQINPRDGEIKKSFETTAEQKQHIKRMYDNQRKRFKITGRKEELYGELDPIKQLERNWKEVGHSPERRDGKLLLVHEGPSCKSERPMLKSISDLTGEDRERYYAKLAEPFRRFPKHPMEHNVNTFSVYTKFRRFQKE